MERYTAPKSMKSIGDLFKRYQKHFKPPQASVEKVCVAVISEILGFNIDSKQVTYNVATKTLYLNLPSILKQEIKLKEKTLLTEIRRELGDGNAPQAIV